MITTAISVFLAKKISSWLAYALSQSCAGEGWRDGVGFDAVQIRAELDRGAEDLGHDHVAPLGDVVAGSQHVLSHTDALKS